ncbi:hypothetical protein OAK19_04245 [Aureispira]|nr:hypothetical protein [Aureispira sp.]
MTFLFFAPQSNFVLAQADKQVSEDHSTPYAPYGGVFTPKGTLKVLLVFVTYKDKSTANSAFYNKNNKLPDWDYTQNNKLPLFVDPVTGDCPSYIFNRDTDFEKYMDMEKNNFSKQFASMSNHKFKLIGEVFKDSKGKPTVVEIDPGGGYSWTQMNGLAVEAMQKMNPNVDLSSFDQRKNRPNFQFDNSDTTIHKADKIIDFVVFVHRYNKNWRQQPKASMRGWIGSGGGFAATGILPSNKLNGYRFAEGFTMTYRSGVFVHEVAHVLFNAPHIMGVNNVVGDFFYLMSAGWGIMAPIGIFSGFNAWERWYSGFIDLVADIKDEKDLKGGNIFVLRDYFTTGDALRIEIPFSGGQHLWLENHEKIHPYDEHPWKGNVLGKRDTIFGTAAGIYAFVESIEGSRNNIFSALSSRANGIKVLNASGNYDYHMYKEKPALKNNWGNVMHSFKRLDPNPISGINNFYRFPFDGNDDGIIEIDPNYNSSKTEWSAPIFREEIQSDSFVNLYGSFGSYNPSKAGGYTGPVAFRDGDYLDINSNPLPLNYPKYILKNKALKPYVLNGLAMKFSAIENSKDMLVEIRFKQVDLCQSRRWAGNIELPDITNDEKADLIISKCTHLIIDKSGTKNTHLITKQGDFVIPSVFTVRNDACLHLKDKSRLIIKDDSKLILEKGARLIMDRKSQIIISPNAELVLNRNGIKKHKSAKIIDQQGKR